MVFLSPAHSQTPSWPLVLPSHHTTLCGLAILTFLVSPHEIRCPASCRTQGPLWLWTLHILGIEILYDLSWTAHRSTDAITLTNDQKEIESWIAPPHGACVHKEEDNLKKSSMSRGWLRVRALEHTWGPLNPSCITLLVTLAKLLG